MNVNKKLVGLSGTNGSGKDTVMNLLRDDYNYLFVSATDMLAAELKRRNWPVDRVHKSKLSAEWRRDFGMDVIVRKAYEEYENHKSEYDGLVVGSLRHPAEADHIHELKGLMIWIDADPYIRYKRIQSNLHHRGQRAEDDKTFEEFLADEEREMHPEGDEATLNGAAVKERSDIFLENDGNDIKAFKTEAAKTLGL